MSNSLYTGGIGGPKPTSAIPLLARSGKQIPNFRRIEWSPKRLADAKQVWMKKFPSIKHRSSSSTYNCLGMVFASRRIGIGSQYLDWLLIEDGYRLVPEDECPMRGDLIVYRVKNEPKHVGFVIDIQTDEEEADWETTILSKWGECGEFIHSPDTVPERYGKIIEYWTERRDYNGSS